VVNKKLYLSIEFCIITQKHKSAEEKSFNDFASALQDSAKSAESSGVSSLETAETHPA
jgi:hypothetical protein